MGEEKKLAVLFPGIGYNFDRPLMRFSAEMARQFGYEVLNVGYTGFPKKIIGNAERLRESFDIAAAQRENTEGCTVSRLFGRRFLLEKYRHDRSCTVCVKTRNKSRAGAVHAVSGDVLCAYEREGRRLPWHG